MEKIINEIFFTLTSNYGVFGALLIISFTLSVLYGFVSFIKEISGTVIKSRFWKRKSMNLRKHQTFLDLYFILKHKLNDVNTSCPIRKKIYIDIISEKIICLKQELEKFVKEDLNQFSNHEFYLKIQEVLDDSRIKSNNDLKAKGMPQFVLDSVNYKFNFIHQIYKNNIKAICYNEYIYSNNTERMCAILDFITTAVQGYMNLLEWSLAEFNGDIKKLKYGGTVCKKCDICVHAKYLSEFNN